MFFIVMLAAVNGEQDETKTILKSSYGVFYEKVGFLAVRGGVTYYTHIWNIPLPKIPYVRIQLVRCDVFLSKYCGIINGMINTVNTITTKLLLEAQWMADKSVRIIDNKNQNSSLEVKRRIRSTDEYDPTLPDWVKDQSVSDKVEKWIPQFVVGKVFNKLTGTASREDIKALNRHLQYIAGAQYENIENINRFNNEITSFSYLSNKRINKLKEATSTVNQFNNDIITKMSKFYDQFERIVRNDTTKLMYLSHVKTLLVTQVIPTCVNMLNIVHDAHREMIIWSKSLTNLNKGKLTPELINVHEMQTVLDHVKHNIKQNRIYKHLTLTHRSASYYYSLSDIMYTRNGTTNIYVSVRFPLHQANSIVPLYKTHTYPVPLATGMYRTKTYGYTFLRNVAPFLAITEDGEHFTEISNAQIQTCTGDKMALSCDGVSQSLQMSSNAKSCAYAVFSNNHDNVMKYCDIRFEDSNYVAKYTTAHSIKSDGSFLVQSNVQNPHNNWRLDCPGKQEVNIGICSECRILVPCYCSLSGPGFFIPPHIRHCDSHESDSTVQYMFHINKIGAATFLSDADQLEAIAMEEKLNVLYTQHTLPNITFHIPDNFSAYVEQSKKYSADFHTVIMLQEKNITQFKDKTDKTLHDVRNFSDQVIRRSESLSKLFTQLIYSIFGDNLGRAITFVFGPVGLSCIAFIISSFDFFPAVIYLTGHRLLGKNKWQRSDVIYKPTTTIEKSHHLDSVI